jgi:hypothetical protein
VSFFDDLLAIHEDVGLAFQAGRLRGFFYLAASCPKDAWIYERAIDDDLADVMYIALKGLIMGRRITLPFSLHPCSLNPMKKGGPSFL